MRPARSRPVSIERLRADCRKPPETMAFRALTARSTLSDSSAPNLHWKRISSCCFDVLFLLTNIRFANPAMAVSGALKETARPKPALCPIHRGISVFERGMSSGLTRGWIPVHVKKTYLIKFISPRPRFHQKRKSAGAESEHWPGLARLGSISARQLACGATKFAEACCCPPIGKRPTSHRQRLSDSERNQKRGSMSLI